MKRKFSVKAVLLVLLLVVMINLPLVHSSYTAWRVDRSGTDVAAQVTGHGVLPPRDDPEYYLSFTFPQDIDPDQTQWTAEVDRATYDRAVEEETVAARVLPDRPAAYSVEGQVTHRLGLVITAFADLALLVMLLLLWRFRGRLRPQLEAVAIGDVERCAPGSALDKVVGNVYVIRGEVSLIGDDELMLDLGDRSVHVALDGHHNPVGYQQPAEVHARLIG